MALHTESAERTSFVSYGKNCPQCNERLVAPDWSKYLDDRRVMHGWSCDDCRYKFKTVVYFSAPK
jgi:hypothetical protein